VAKGVIEGEFQGPVRPKPERLSHGQFRLVVEALDGTGGDRPVAIFLAGVVTASIG
jgi:hypothetical protein